MEGKSRENIWKELKDKFLLTYEVTLTLFSVTVMSVCIFCWVSIVPSLHAA